MTPLCCNGTLCFMLNVLRRHTCDSTSHIPTHACASAAARFCWLMLGSSQNRKMTWMASPVERPQSDWPDPKVKCAQRSCTALGRMVSRGASAGALAPAAHSRARCTCVLGGAPYRVVRCAGTLPACLMSASMRAASSCWPWAAPGGAWKHAT